MTIAVAWVAKHSDGRRHLYFATDSRTRGGYVFDACPKILTLPRSDSAICFAGELDWSYPLMIQISNAIAAHRPSRRRYLDITHVKDHLLRIATDLVKSVENSVEGFNASSATFISGGYSWRKADFLLWTLKYDRHRGVFVARPSKRFHPRLKKAAFIGDWAKRYRSRLFQTLKDDNGEEKEAEHQPLFELSSLLKESCEEDTIGGPPQVVRIGAHMNTRIFLVPWYGYKEMTLLGRRLFDYENCDYWSINPETGVILPPPPIGRNSRSSV